MKKRADKPTESSVYVRLNILTLSVAPSQGRKDNDKNTQLAQNIQRKA